MSRTVTHAGVSRLDGTFRLCTSNHYDYERTLIRRHHTDIDILELPHPMTRDQILVYFQEINFANGNAEIQAVLDAAARRRGILPAEDPEAETLADEAEEALTA